MCACSVSFVVSSRITCKLGATQTKQKWFSAFAQDMMSITAFLEMALQQRGQAGSKKSSFKRMLFLLAFLKIARGSIRKQATTSPHLTFVWRQAALICLDLHLFPGSMGDLSACWRNFSRKALSDDSLSSTGGT
jgi:hypothetical protein